MPRFNIKENNITFRIYEGDLVEVANEDGLGQYPVSHVIATFGDKEYIYPSHFLAHFTYVEEIQESVFMNSRDLCNNFINQIKQHGSINTEKWTELKDEPRQESLEEKWYQDWAEEERQRKENP